VSRLGHLRTLFARFAFLLLIGASFALMLLGKADTYLVERLRTGVADVVTPIADAMSRPAVLVSGVVDNVRELAAIREENARLRVENERLLQWQTTARRLEAQNDSLKALLNFAPEPRAAYVSARVVADTGGSFAHSLLITAGGRDGVRKGQAVISGEGLVGRIAEAGGRSARVLLVSDINSRIPVAVGNVRQRAVLAGDNSMRPRLLYLKAPAAVAPGDRVVTSGDAGAFPPGLPVGVVTAVLETEVRVEPFFQRDRLDYVRVVDYGLEGILADVLPGDRRTAAVPTAAGD
jgi:rod shape-determining protein MreC